MDSSSTARKRSSPSCADDVTLQVGSRGATLVEVLIALIVGSGVIAGAVTLAFSSRVLFDSSERRNVAAQSAQAAINVLSNDIREAGLMLPLDFPAIEVIDGPFGTPDELILRRGLNRSVLPVCGDLTASSTRVAVSFADTSGTPPAGCVPIADADADGWPDNMQEWRDLRIASGGSILAYVYQPIDDAGEFFEIVDEDSTNLWFDVGGGGSWSRDYTVAAQSRIYLLEERRYRLTGDLLEQLVDGDGATPRGVQDHIEDFQVTIVLADGTVKSSLSAADDWSAVETIKLMVKSSVDDPKAPIEREVVASFNPRNTLSL